MRFVTSISFALITIGMIYLDNPEPLNRFANQSAQQVNHLLLDKNVSYEGLSYVRSEEIEVLLPMEKSIPWWLFNKSQIETGLLRHSLVKKALLETCDTFAIAEWGCFKVLIQERHPAYAALIEDEVWILGEDGGLLFPVSREQFDSQPLTKILSKNLARDVSSDVNLKILQVAGSSPDLIHARLSYTRRALEIIEENSGLEAAMARCSHQGEIRIRFDNYPFEVLFDYSEDAPKTLALEAQRLAALLKEFGARAQTIELIDLAYNKLAIVRFHDAQLEESARASAKTMFTTKPPRSNLKGAAKSPSAHVFR